MKKIAGIVVYYPDYERLTLNINAIYSQVDYLIIYCNSFVDCLKIPDKKYLWLNKDKETNDGVAHAINKIMSTADELEAEWCLLLDQDSIVPLDIIKKYEAFLTKKNERIAIVGPCVKNENARDNSKRELSAEAEIVPYCITSASYNNIRIWKQIGKFREDLFIDYVDWEYAARVRENGYIICRLNEIILDHQLGRLTYHQLGRHEVSTFNHSAFRKYYITRNSFIIYKLHPNEAGFKHPFLRTLKRLFVIILYEDQKTKKCISVVKGIVAYMKWCYQTRNYSI